MVEQHSQGMPDASLTDGRLSLQDTKKQIHYTNTQLLIYKYISWDASLIIAPRQTVLSVSKKVFPYAEDKDFEFQIWKRKI